MLHHHLAWWIITDIVRLICWIRVINGGGVCMIYNWGIIVILLMWVVLSMCWGIIVGFLGFVGYKSSCW